MFQMASFGFSVKILLQLVHRTPASLPVETQTNCTSLLNLIHACIVAEFTESNVVYS